METPAASSDALRVTDGGLHAEASWCESLAARLAANNAPFGSVTSGLPSAAAVNTANSVVVAAGTRCAMRMQATAAALTAAATGYTENEATSAAMMRAVAPPRMY
jgi:hypothetical protein